jgi:exosome complex component CSL4
MQLCHDSGSMVIPGDCIGQISTTTTATATPTTPLSIQYVAGEGTYIRNGSIVASIVGQVNVSSTSIPITSELKDVTTNTDGLVKKQENNLPQLLEMVTVSVLPNDGCFRAKQQVIRVGQTILGRVIRIGMTQQQVLVDIVANPYGVLDSVANGTIRRDDVTKLLVSSTTKATPQSLNNTALPIQLSQSFRVGDWIAAKVISLGDDSNRRSYYLSTAESSLGVIYAICSTSGQRMIPVSHREMECPQTGTIEARKCARPPTIRISPPITTTKTK